MSEAKTALARYDAMCRAIDEAYEVDEVKDIRDKAKAIEEYSRQAKNIEAERRACEIRLRAERKAGQLLAQMEKAKGAQYGGRKAIDGHRAQPSNPKAKLSDLGISKNQSSQWQKLGSIPDEQFEKELKKPGKPTTSGIIGSVNKAPPQGPKHDPNALWLWGRLREFQTRGLMAKPLSEVLDGCDYDMQADILRIGGNVARWLMEAGDE